ncbi:MAG TPA: cyclic nucleotide-binding domain-containing protein [Ardenticatenaceae bacterium]
MKRRYLDKAPLFVALSREERQALTDRFTLVRFKAGDTLFSQGSPPQAIFLLKSGTVRLTTREGGQEQPLGTFEPGSLLGEMDLLLDRPHEVTAFAEGPLEAWWLTRDALVDLLVAYPSLRYAFPVRVSNHLLTPVDRGAAEQALRNVPLFGSLSDEVLEALVGCLALRHAAANEVIYSMGEAGDALYLVDRGAVKLMDGSETVERKESGDYFGEMALLLGRPRDLTARAARVANLWVLAKRDFDALAMRYPELTHNATRILVGMLSRGTPADDEQEGDSLSLAAFPLFSTLAPDEQADVARRMRPTSLAPNEILFREGDAGAGLYLVERGQVTLSSQQGILDMVPEGSFLGEMALLTGNPHNVTAQAIAPTDLLVLDRDDFVEVVDKYPTISLLLSRALDSRLEAASARGSLPAPVAPTATAVPHLAPSPVRRRSLARIALVLVPLLLLVGVLLPALRLNAAGGNNSSFLAAILPGGPPNTPTPLATPLPERGTAALLSQPDAVPPTNTPEPTRSIPPSATLQPTRTLAPTQTLEPTRRPPAPPTMTQMAIAYAPPPSATSTETTVPTETPDPEPTNTLLPLLPPTIAAPPTRTPVPVAQEDAPPVASGPPALPPTVALPSSTPPVPPAATSEPTTAAQPTAESTTAAQPTAEPTTAPVAAAEAPRSLDSRLSALGVTIEPASVAPGEPYWRVVEIIWHDESQSGGRHSIFVDVSDEQGERIVGQPLTVSWGGGSQQLTIENKPFPEYGANFPMYAAGQAYSLQVNGLPSDRVHGMGLGDLTARDWTIHVEYLVKYQRAIR